MMTNVNFNEQFVGDFNTAKQSSIFIIVRRGKAVSSEFCKVPGEDGNVGWSHK